MAGLNPPEGTDRRRTIGTIDIPDLEAEAEVRLGEVRLRLTIVNKIEFCFFSLILYSVQSRVSRENCRNRETYR